MRICVDCHTVLASYEKDRCASCANKERKRQNEVYLEHVTTSPWYVVVDDLIGGCLVATVNKPASQLDPTKNEFAVADFVLNDIASAIVELHNKSLENS